MPLNDQVSADIAAAMKARDSSRLSALRMLKAAVMNKSVEKGRDLDDAEILQVVASLVKQRRDSIEQFAKAGRTDLVERRRPNSRCSQPTCRRRRQEIDAAVAGDCGDRCHICERPRQGDEGRHAEARRQECRRESG